MQQNDVVWSALKHIVHVNRKDAEPKNLFEKKKLIALQHKIEQRETRREEKALIAAKLETAIEKQLIEQLENGVYKDIYSLPKQIFDKSLKTVEDESPYKIESEEEVKERERVEVDAGFESECEDIEEFRLPKMQN